MGLVPILVMLNHQLRLFFILIIRENYVYLLVMIMPDKPIIWLLIKINSLWLVGKLVFWLILFNV